jgi:hypothetical protein
VTSRPNREVADARVTRARARSSVLMRCKVFLAYGLNRNVMNGNV